jgi:hypothetical protein
LDSADNYLNINPLGLNVGIRNNLIDSVRIGMSLDGFLREVEEEDDIFDEKGFYIDPHLLNGMVKGADVDTYLFPYISYQGWEGFRILDTELEVEG